MTNTEKNRLIEAFMGWELKWVTDRDLNQWCFVNKHTGKTISGMYNTSELPYCTDWNWLMEALKTFNELSYHPKYESLGYKGSMKYIELSDNLDYSVTLCNIYDTVNALCEGIKWYNSIIN